MDYIATNLDSPKTDGFGRAGCVTRVNEGRAGRMRSGLSYRWDRIGRGWVVAKTVTWLV